MPSVYEDLARRHATSKREGTFNIGYVLFAVVVVVTAIHLFMQFRAPPAQSCEITVLGDVGSCDEPGE